MKLVEFGGIKFTNKTPFEIKDMIVDFKSEWVMTLIPTFKLASQVFNSKYEFRDTNAKMYNDYIVNHSGLSGNVKTFAQAIWTLASKFDIDNFCDRFIDRFKNGIDVYSLSVADAALVNKLIGLQFFSKYSLSILHYIEILECNTYSENVALSSYSITEQQKVWIDAQSGNYKTELAIISKNVKKIYEDIDKLPTTFISDMESSKSGFTGSNKNGIDAEDIKALFKIGGIIVGVFTGVSAIVQTVYWRMSGGTALVIAKNIQKQKQLKTALELRLVHLQNLREGTASASVEKNIQITEDRLRKIEKELYDVEKKYDK